MKTRNSFSFSALAATLLMLVIAGVSPAMAADNCTKCVDATGGTKSGADCWGKAYLDLQPALQAAVSGDVICVAQGTYKPTSGTDRAISFQLKPGVTLQGGYPNGGGTRGPAYKTILSGHIGNPDAKSDNSFNVVLFDPEQYTETTTIDGFTITGGYADILGSPDGSTPNATKTSYVGGGMYIAGDSILTNLTVSDNYAVSSGGGLFFGRGKLTLRDSTFTGNTVGGENSTGGAIYLQGSEQELTNVTVSGNSANYGGGIFAYSERTWPILTNVTISGNSANYEGGGVFSTSCYNDDTLTLELRNAILWGNSRRNSPGNSPENIPDQFVIGAHGVISISNSVVQEGCSPDQYILCSNIITTDPKLGPLGDNGWYTQTMALLAGSSAIDTGVDYGVQYDQRGVTRPQGPRVDIGAFEVAQGDTTPPVIEILTATPNVLWPANGKPVSVIVTVKATDPGPGASGVDSAMLAINDEYREYNSWPVAMQGSNGVFTKTLSLVARRNGNDLDGRKYTLTVTVKDKANPANISEQSVVVLVPHDQGKK